MKRIFTLLFSICSFALLQAQDCISTDFDKCKTASGLSSDFRNAVQVTGTGNPLTVGAKYKFTNALPTLNLDAIVTIDAIVNATMENADEPNIDDDKIIDESGSAQAALFSPRIAPDQVLSCNDRSGYVEFTVKFYTHYNGNGLPVASSEIAITDINFLQFNMTGRTIGTNGWLKKISYIKTAEGDPINFRSTKTELSEGGDKNGWLLSLGGTKARTDFSTCENIIEKSVFTDPRSSISFRVGYEYKAPSNCARSNNFETLQFGSKFSCYKLPTAAPLQVSLNDLAGQYNTGKIDITWTTLQENNLDSYEIQRSFDGVSFEVAGNMKAKNSASVQLYKFPDNVANFNNKYIYYRLRIIDVAHSQKLTNVIVVKIADPKGNEMIVAPNPSSSNAQIRVAIKKAGAGDITVLDATGKIVLKQQASLLVGNNTVVLNNITTLNGGYYTIRLIANNETFTSKLLIWK